MNQENNGDLIFHPVDDMPTWNKEINIKALRDRWALTVSPEYRWERVWLQFDNDKIVGSASIRAGHLNASRHRASFSIGLEKFARGKGYGRQLMTTAMNWAKEQMFLDWIDIYAFSNNEKALRLYKSFGFEEIGTTVDIFRIKGQSIDDIHMCLKLR